MDERGVDDDAGGGNVCFVEGDEEWETEEARVDVDAEREKVAWPGPVSAEKSELLDKRDADRDRAMFSNEFFLVWDGERFGILGGSSSQASRDRTDCLK